MITSPGTSSLTHSSTRNGLLERIVSKVDDKLSSKWFGSTSADHHFITSSLLSGTHIFDPKVFNMLKGEPNILCCCHSYINTMPKSKKLLFAGIMCKLSCQHIPSIQGGLSLNSKNWRDTMSSLLAYLDNNLRGISNNSWEKYMESQVYK